MTPFSGVHSRMSFDSRKVAIATAGFCAFLNLYSPQALLPELAEEFGVGPAAISATMTAGTAAIALTAPFTGASEPRRQSLPKKSSRPTRASTRMNRYSR